MRFNLEYEDVIEKKELIDNYTINDLLNDLDLTPLNTVVKQNGKITVNTSKINDGDEIKIIKIIHGG